MSKWVDRQLRRVDWDVEVGRQAVCAGSTGCRSGSVGSLRRVNRMSKWVDGQFGEVLTVVRWGALRLGHPGSVL